MALLISCFDDGDCISTTTDVLSISFKKYASNETDTVEINDITMIGTDSVFYPLVAVTGITLPLDPNVNSLKINFDFELTDRELILDYATVPRMISPDCGVELLYSNLLINDHDFDSVTVIKNSLDEEQTSVNIVIYQ